MSDGPSFQQVTTAAVVANSQKCTWLRAEPVRLLVPVAAIHLQNKKTVIPAAAPWSCDDPAGAPVRCSGCKGYINASVKWRDSGREWMCNMCGVPNVVNRCFMQLRRACSTALAPRPAMSAITQRANASRA